MSDDWDDGFDDSFLEAVDQLVAQHQGTKAQLTQPDSPNARAAAAAGAPGPPVAAALQQQPQRQQQQQQQQNWAGQVGPTHPGPPLPSHTALGPQQPRPGTANGSHRYHPQQPHQQQQPAPPVVRPNTGGLPLGRVSQAAAELRGQLPPFMPGPAAAQGSTGGPLLTADPQHQLAQLQQERDRLQRELGALEGTNKLLRSNLDQADRERINLRQRLQQLESKGPAPGTQSSFTLAELQKQLEALKQQLLFREQEMEELKRQQSDKLERLREAEAAVQKLQAQVQEAQQAVKQQQAQQAQRSVLVERGQRQGVSVSVAAPHPSSMQQQQQQQGQQVALAAGQKRRQSEGGETFSVAPAQQPRAPPQAPPLGPAAAAAALGLWGPSEGLVSRLWAVCGQSLSALLGGGPSGAGPAGPLTSPLQPPFLPPPAAAGMAAGWPMALGVPGGAAAAPPTALLLRLQAKASAAAAPDALAAGFCQAFGRQLQQVALGQLPAAALIDSIGALAAAVVVSCQEHAGGQAGAAGAGSSRAGAGAGQGPRGMLPQQARLLSEGLIVLQHLLEHDASCRQAAVESSCSAGTAARPALGSGSTAAACSGGGGSGTILTALASASGQLAQLQLSHRVSLRGGPEGAKAPPHAAAATAPSSAIVGAGVGSSRGPLALPQCEAALQQHAALFEGKGQGLASILVAVGLLAARQKSEGLLGAALGALCALAAGVAAGGRMEALKPVFETGAMEKFLRPPQLRAQALQLLHLLLRNQALSEAFEQSLSQASPGVQGGETPGSHRASGTLPSGDVQSSSREQAGSGKDGSNSGPSHGATVPMQVDGSGWAGASAVLHHVLQSLTLAPATNTQRQQGQGQGQGASHRGASHSHSHPPAAQHAQQQQQAPGGREQQGAAAAAAQAGRDSVAAAGAAALSVPRQALMLVAMLREQGSHGILLHLLSPEDVSSGGSGSGGGEGLCQRLIQLIDAASAAQQQHDTQAGPSLLLPAQFPLPLPGPPAEGGGAEAAAAQLAWQQRLRLMQETLTLLRGLQADDTLGSHVMDELCSSPAFSRLCLATLGRVSRLEPPPPRAAAACPPLPLAPWAHAIGSSSKAEGIDQGQGAGAGGRGAVRCCSAVDVVYMARGLRHRVLCRLKAAQHP